MKNLFVFLFILFSFAARAADSLPPLDAIVSYVIDGDTFAAKVRLENGALISVKVRMLGIDAPEMHGECKSEILRAIQSKDKLKEFLPKKSIVRLYKIKDDKYLGRIDALVMNDSAGNVAAKMAELNLARPYDGGRRRPWCSAAEIAAEKSEPPKPGEL